MSNQTIQIIIMITVLVGVLGALIGLLPYLKSKGVNVSAILDNAQKATDSFDKVLGVVQDILPNNPTVGLLTIIEKWAKIGVGNAEQLYHSGDISETDRATIAAQTVYNVLAELKITVDDNKKVLIDAAIKEAVLNLGHTKPAVAQIAVKQPTVVIAPKYMAPDGTELKPVEPITTATNTSTVDTNSLQDTEGTSTETTNTQ